jgi:hypothetical protein
MERKDIAKELRDDFGFSLRVQKDYYLVRKSSEERLIRLRRCNPDRFLTVSWMETDTLSDSLIIAERERLSGLYQNPVKIYPEHNRFYSYENGFSSGRILRGLWGLTDGMGGGPFFTIAFKDESRRRVYFLDGSVFAPGREKFPFLQQLEVMARTFSPVNNQ